MKWIIPVISSWILIWWFLHPYQYSFILPFIGVLLLLFSLIYSLAFIKTRLSLVIHILILSGYSWVFLQQLSPKEPLALFEDLTGFRAFALLPDQQCRISEKWVEHTYQSSFPYKQNGDTLILENEQPAFLGKRLLLRGDSLIGLDTPAVLLRKF